MLRVGVALVAASVVAWAACLGAAASASAQTYPQRTVKFILPFGPGSGADITMRLFSDKLAQRWGKPVVIENRPGGDGLVAIHGTNATGLLGRAVSHGCVRVSDAAVSRLYRVLRPGMPVEIRA